MFLVCRFSNWLFFKAIGLNFVDKISIEIFWVNFGLYVKTICCLSDQFFIRHIDGKYAVRLRLLLKLFIETSKLVRSINEEITWLRFNVTVKTGRKNYVKMKYETKNFVENEDPKENNQRYSYFFVLNQRTYWFRVQSIYDLNSWILHFQLLEYQTFVRLSKPRLLIVVLLVIFLFSFYSFSWCVCIQITL